MLSQFLSILLLDLLFYVIHFLSPFFLHVFLILFSYLYFSFFPNPFTKAAFYLPTT